MKVHTGPGSKKTLKVEYWQDGEIQFIINKAVGDTIFQAVHTADNHCYLEKCGMWF